jgi:hypothetical protein
VLAVVHGDRQTDEVRQDRRTTRPGLDRLLVLGSLSSFDLFHQVGVAERTFFNERVMFYPLFLAAARDDHRSRTLVAASSYPWSADPTANRVTALQSAFTTTVRVVDRVHDTAANGRTNTAPTHRTGLADLAQVVLFVADFTDGGAAFDVNATHFTGAQTNLSVGTFAGHQHDSGTSGTGDLRTLARQHFDAVDGRTDGMLRIGRVLPDLIGASEPLIS